MSRAKRKSSRSKKRGEQPAGSWQSYLIVLGVVAVGIFQASALRWYCDDIFITLRYLDNLFAGNGLVYNQGEYVEGYTHALWLGVLALSRWVGFDQLSASMNIGLASYAAVLLLFAWISFRLNANRLAVFVPFTALVLALHYDFQVWATSGLETMFFTFLWSLAFLVYFFTSIKRDVKIVLTGAILILAVLTRPDGALIFILANVFLAARGILLRSNLKRLPRELALFNLPFVCLHVPYLFWKWSYYGDIFPNTYYAKSSNLSYYERGFYYLWLYFKTYFTSCLFVLGIPALIVGYYRTAGRGETSRFDRVRKIASGSRYAALVFALCAILLYGTLFIARVGGDFMYARFVVPIIPFAIFVTEASILELARGRRIIPVAVFLILVCVVGFAERHNRDRLLLKEDKGEIVTVSHHGIIDERHYYKNTPVVATELRWAQDAAARFRDLDMTVLLMGQAGMGYYAGFKTCIEYYGLTDPYIAHMTLEKRSRVGHEKQAPLDYVIERGGDFLFSRKWPYSDRPENYRRIAFKLARRGVTGYLITYDADLIRSLAGRFGKAFEYMDFEELMDWYIDTKLPQSSYDELSKDYEEFRRFYFMHNDDTVRESAFLRRLRELKPSR